MKPFFLRATLPLLAALAAPASLSAQLYTSGHADLGIAYEGGDFEPHWHLDEGSVVNGMVLPHNGGTGYEYAPGGMTAVIGETAAAASLSSDYLGVAPGTTIFITGPVGKQPNLGFGAEELDPDDWIGDITVSLTGWVLPSWGQFALYDTNGSGTTTTDVVFSTLDGGATVDGNLFTIPPGFHEHFTFGFTTVGEYEITLTWTGNHVGDGHVSQSGTFGFQVVPEPTTGALLGMGLIILLRRRHRS